MKKIFIYSITMALGMSSLGAYAAIPFTCTSTDEIEKKAESCDDNASFTKAGQTCLGSLELLIQAKSLMLNKQLQEANKVLAQGTNAQKQNIAGANASYKASMDSLNDLINAAKYAKSNVGGYIEHVYYPEDFDAPPEVIGDPIEFLDSSECYADNEKALKAIVSKIDGHITDLETAKQTAMKLKDATKKDQSNLDAIGLPPVNAANGTQKKNTGAKAVKSHDSSISGEITNGESKKVQEQEKK